MQDKAETAAGIGDLRAGPFAFAAGALLAIAGGAAAWSGELAAPAGIAAAVAVCGGSLLAQRFGLGAAGLAARRSGVARFATCPDPVFVTDLGGRVIAANPAADLAPGAAALVGWSTDPRASLYRLLREVRANGVAAEPAADPGRRITVVRQAARRLLWRIERAPGASDDLPGLAAAGVPWLRIDKAGLVVRANAALQSLAGAAPERIDALLADPPLRRDGVHVLAGGQIARAVVLPAGDGLTDVLLIPLDVAEVSGLVPDHFLEDLPVALARLEVSGRLTFANKAARQLLGPRAEPRVDEHPALAGAHQGRVALASRRQDLEVH